MKKIIIALSTSLFAIATVYYGVSIYALTTNNIEELIVICLNPEKNHYPPIIPEYYMLNYRGTKEDLDLLREGNGIGFILNSAKKPRDKAIKYASFFLDKGIDVNATGRDGATALHGAVMFNQWEDATFLIEKGADTNIKMGYSYIRGQKEETPVYGMTALKLAKHMSKRDGMDRSKIIKLLY